MFALTVRFKLPPSTDFKQLRAVVTDRAQLYAGLTGLRSKAFVLDEASREYGGNYVWETRAALDAFLKSELFQAAIAKFGNPQMHVHEIVAYLERGAVVAKVPGAG